MLIGGALLTLEEGLLPRSRPRWAQEASGAGTKPAGMALAPRLFRLSHPQRRILYGEQIAPGTSFANLTWLLRLPETVGLEHLRQGVHHVLAARRDLWWRFTPDEEHWVAQYLEAPDGEVPLHDFSHPEGEHGALAWCRLQAQTPRPLYHRPLIRLEALVLPQERLGLLLQGHHALLDGTSAGQLRRDLWSAIVALADGQRPAPFPEEAGLPGFLDREQAYLASPEAQRHRQQWAAWLREAPSPLRLGRPEVQSWEIETLQVCLDPGLFRSLVAFQQEHGVTRYQVLLTALAGALAELTGQQRFLLASGNANRHHPANRAMLGMLVSTFPVLLSSPEGGSFLTRLQEHRAWLRAALQGPAAYPYDLLVAELAKALSRDVWEGPHGQVAFVDHPDRLEPADQAEWFFPGHDPCVLTLHSNVRHATAQGRLECDLLFRRGALARTEVEALVQRWWEILERGLARPRDPWSSSPRGAALPGPPASTLVPSGAEGEGSRAASREEPTGLFDGLLRQAVRFPDKVALRQGQQELSYAQLRRRVEAVAVALQGCGIGPEQRIGVALPRGIDQVVAALGVMRAGAVYVPLDPGYPPERLAFVQRDADLKELWRTAPEEAEGTLREVRHPELAAYMIYTSGSTGQPKGVVVTQANLDRLARELSHAWASGSPGRVLAFASPSFDAAIAELCVALPRGDTLVLASAEELRPGPALQHTLQSQGCTQVTLPPSSLDVLSPDGLDSLGLLVVAGEVCPPGLLQRWAGGRTVINAYGPTEATVCATYAVCRTFEGPRLPIGSPLSYASVYVLDERLEPVPQGEAGELYLGGDGVARGYHRRPGLTAERFLPDPFSAQPGARMYRTGDWVRQLPDGQLDFLGRVDHQLKLRGYRIEPGEVEVCLLSHPWVREAQVLARGQNLVAYLRVAEDALTDPQLQSQRVEGWRELYRKTAEVPVADPTFHIVGWNSSYTGQPLPEPEMRCWVEDTVARLANLGPSPRILEIGCGTGLLLCRLAPSCEQYVGLDFSESSLAHVASLGLPNVQCHQGRADEMPDGEFDLVILNSVIQYFPSLDYLDRVVGEALRRVRSGGAVFLGDVRHLGLLESFQQRVVAARHPHLSAERQAEMVSWRCAREEELLLSPAAFSRYATTSSRVSQVRVWPKRGRYDNELSHYRYDVVLEVERAPALPIERWLEGEQAGPWPPQGVVGWRRVPNARFGPGRHPEEFWEVGAEVSWASAYPDGAFDVAFHGGSAWLPPAESSPRWANAPLLAALEPRLVGELQALCQRRLPSYMVPSAMVALEAFPLTPQGKVDRARLPVPSRLREQTSAPESSEERCLAALWEEILGVRGIQREDHFFELGGHSLAAAQVLARLRTEMAVDLPLPVFFEKPRLHQLAAEIARVREVARLPLRPPLRSQGEVTQAPLSRYQELFGSLVWRWPDSPMLNMPYALSISGELDEEALRQGFERVTLRHPVLRTTFHGWPDAPLQRVTCEAAFPWRTVDLSSETGSELRATLARLQAEEGARPFALDRELPWRVVLVRCSPTEHRLLLTLHHLVFDGWSLGLLLHEWRQLSHAWRQGRPSPCPSLPAHYLDYAHWQRAWLTPERLEQQRLHWRRLLGQASRWLDLPYDRPRPDPETFGGGVCLGTLSAEEERRLGERATALGVTPFLVAVAALALVVRSVTRNDDFVLGFTFADRRYPPTDRMLGLFANVLGLRCDLRARPDRATLLQRLQASYLQASLHPEISTADLRALMVPEGSPPRPHFQVTFGFHNFPRAEELDDGLQWNVLPVEELGNTACRVDLEVNLYPRSGGGFRVVFTYATDLFDGATIQDWLERYLEALQALLQEPERPLP